MCARRLRRISFDCGEIGMRTEVDTSLPMTLSTLQRDTIYAYDYNK